MQARSRLVDVGGTVIELVGSHPVVDLVGDELGAESPAEPVGTIEVVAGPLPIPTHATTLGPVSASADRAQVRLEGTGVSIETGLPLGTAPFSARVGIAPRSLPFGLPPKLFRWVGSEFATQDESQVPRFIRWVLDSMIFLHCTDRAVLHGAAVERDGLAVAITSSGGVGKSTTAATMIDELGWGYLADGMTIVSPGAPVHPYRMHRNVLEHNVNHRPEVLRRLRWHGGPAGRLQWALAKPVHGAERRRRLSVEQLHRPGVYGQTAPAGLVVFLARGSQDEPLVTTLNAHDLARRSAEIITFEFPEAITLMCLAGAAIGTDLAAPRLAAITDTYEAFFAGVPHLCEIRMPAGGITPIEVARLIEAEATP